MNDFDFLTDDIDFDKIELPKSLKVPIIPTTKKIIEPPKEIEHKIETSLYLHDFKISGIFTKDKIVLSKLKIPMTKDNKLLRLYNEKQIIKNMKNPKYELPKYSNYLFTKWQNELIDYIHSGSNVILKIATSCGKTWSCNSIISYYTLMGQNTALFIMPNSEILRENVNEILTKNKKTYLSGSTNIVDTQTKFYSSYDERNAPNTQIMCLSSDNFINFITNDNNIHFIKKLKYLVFDEVHLPEVANNYLWANLIPVNAQYILLSATINNLEELTESMSKLSDNKINIIEYNIRPIPLQRILINKEMKLTYQININDPTIRDICEILSHTGGHEESKLEKMSREELYIYGQQVVTKAKGVTEKTLEDISNAILEPTQINIYNILNYLLTNDLGPVLVFGTNSADVQNMVNQLVNYIKYLEDNDIEYVNAEKYYNLMEKKLKEEEYVDEYSKKGQKLERLNESESIDMNIIKKLYKYKFPLYMNENKVIKNKYSWYNNALEYGIGVYTLNIPMNTRSKFYSLFKEGNIKIMFADTSISVGINLPIRTCVLTGNITPTLYKQMGGRAGRRGLDTKGYILPLFNKEQVIKCLLNDGPDDEKINLKLMLSYLDIIKLTIPELLSTYYFTPVKNKEKKIKKLTNEVNKLKAELAFNEKNKSLIEKINTIEKKIMIYKSKENYELIKSHDEATILSKLEKPGKLQNISELRKFILNKYIDLKLDDKILEKMDFIKKSGLNYHILSNIIQMADNIETIIFIMALINGDLEYITCDQDLIDFISTIIYRNPGDKLLISSELIEKIEKYKLAFNNEVPDDINYKEPINNYLSKFLSYHTYEYSYLDNIIKFGNWFYLILKYIRRIAPETYKLKDLIINIDKKYMNSALMCGITCPKKK